MPDTVEHFWRMLWQEKVTNILMVTGLIEEGIADDIADFVFFA